MPVQTATPYLILNGRALRALELYERSFGAHTQVLQRFEDVDGSCSGARPDRVMHATLQVGNALLMLSDGPDDAAATPSRGLVSVALTFDTEAELRASYDVLAETGASIVPVHDAPWGALFGVVEDELGVHWMLTCRKGTRTAH